MKELHAKDVRINDLFWSPRLMVNARQAIFHQWKQLEATGCIDNFRIAAGEKEGFREGWYFADSDAYKWLDAASRIYALQVDPELASLMDELIALLARAQTDDGYLFTYNQIHFPGQRWVNLQIEHELYCLGHLIEAGVSHYEATGRRDLLDVCIRAADLLVRDFTNASSDKTCGHEEIELALVRLYRVTRKQEYLELARRFVERRGRVPLYGLLWARQRRSHIQRKDYVNQLRQAYIAQHPEYAAVKLPGDNFAKTQRLSHQRWYLNAISGMYNQQHAPVHQQTVPVGHSVRFGYLETAAAMLTRETQDVTLLATMEQAWERMVTRRMYITGGLGAVPGIEGFGADYELDPEYAYAETCASIASLFWNWEMALITGKAQYSDLLEWQLYNAAIVGMGQHGDTYLYNNPLEVHHGVRRKGWYIVPCCPSNLSRTIADLGKHIYSYDEDRIWIHQLIGSETNIDHVQIKIESRFPWDGNVRVHIKPEQSRQLKLHIRKPSWTGQSLLYDPCEARYEIVERLWSSQGEMLAFDFDMSIKLRHAHTKVKGHAGKVAITRGPLVYCLEGIDNRNVDIFAAELAPLSLEHEYVPDLLGGCVVIHGKTTDGRPLTFIPYFLWANREESQMTVWVNCKS